MTATIQDLTAPCGLDCFNCEAFTENITEQFQQFLATQLKVAPEDVPCPGCRLSGGCRLHFSHCATLDCVTEKGLHFCFECEEFPCIKLQPAVDGANRYPHNMKVYNLCRMKAVGVEEWAREESKAIRARYYKGRLVVGAGPVLEEM